MKILILSRYDRLGASSRLRMFQYVAALSSEGIDWHMQPLLNDSYVQALYERKKIPNFYLMNRYLRRFITLLLVFRFDLVWIEKEIFPNFPSWFECLLRCFRVPYMVDFDDAIFHNYDLARNPIKRLLRKKIDKVMCNSALVVCGNSYLAERARSANARQVEIIPTVIDLVRYGVLSPVFRERIVVGWVGSPSTVKYLDVVAPALMALAAEFPLQLRVIGAQFAWPGLDVDCRPWSEESEVSEIQDFDIGIMPLLDSPWERGKCGYKLIQYMACGKPVVASPVGVNQEIVVHDTNGYLASTVDEWAHALRLLFSNKQNQLVMGAHGRRSVEEKYCLQVTAPRLAQLFHEVVAKGAH